MKFYFIYAVPNIEKQTILLRIFRKLYKFFIAKYYCNLNYKNVNHNFFNKWPIQSPFENTKNIYLSLRKDWETYLFDLKDPYQIKFTSNDIFLGHPFFPITNKTDKAITEFAMISNIKPKVRALITPLHCNTNIKTNHINEDFLNHVDSLISNTDIIFGIMGKYWWDQWEYSKYANWKKKMVRLDMAVDIKRYNKIKNKFNDKHKRKFFYIGRNDSMKGTDFLTTIAKSCPEYEFGWIGSGDHIEGVNKISNFVELTNDFMKKIAIEYDFFISPSRADPNPTTILETMAWGFPVLCTAQSGYYEDDVITNIFLDDIEKTKIVLKKFQEMDDKELHEMSINSRKKVSNFYNWDIFTEKIKSNINSLYYS